MSAHTPGPWLYETRFRLVVNTVHPHVVVCAIPGERSEVGLANARLIASAPELLEALKHAAQFIEGELGVMERSFLPEPNSGEQVQLETARTLLETSQAAIAKAEGRS